MRADEVVKKNLLAQMLMRDNALLMKNLESL
jgi:hypothetical protein